MASLVRHGEDQDGGVKGDGEAGLALDAEHQRRDSLHRLLAAASIAAPDPAAVGEQARVLALALPTVHRSLLWAQLLQAHRRRPRVRHTEVAHHEAHGSDGRSGKVRQQVGVARPEAIGVEEGRVGDRGQGEEAADRRPNDHLHDGVGWISGRRVTQRSLPIMIVAWRTASPGRYSHSDAALYFL